MNPSKRKIIVQIPSGQKYTFKNQGQVRENMSLTELRKILEKDKIMEKDDIFQTSDTQNCFSKSQEPFTILEEDFLCGNILKVCIHKVNDKKIERQISFKKEPEGNIFLSDLNDKQIEKLLNNFHYLYGINFTKNLDIVTGQELFFENDDENKKFDPPYFADRNRMNHVSESVTAENISEAKNKLNINAKLEANINFLCNVGLSGGYNRETLKEESHKKSFRLTTIVVEKGKIQLSGVRSIVSSKVKNFFKPDQEITKENVEQFFETFGTYIPTKITIGGRLLSQESTEEKHSSENKENEWNIGANANIPGIPASGSFGVGGANSKTKEKNNEEEKVSIQVVGGNVAFSKDEDDWVQSIHENYQSWEIISIDNFMYTYEFLEEPFKTQIWRITHTTKIDYPNGDCFEGTFDDDKRVNGRLSYSNGNVYEGDWKQNLRDGKGKYTFKNGDIYEGEWKGDKMNGQGKYYYSNGDFYEGDWKDNIKDGKGIYKYSSGNIYEGEWKNGQKNGKGKVIYRRGDIYEGDWKDGKKNGKGKLVMKIGGVYEGDWENDKKNGNGKLNYANGDVYEGEWKDDHKHGRGTLTLNNGEAIVGTWFENQLLSN